MSDFLSNLVAISLNQKDVIQPRLAGRFESIRSTVGPVDERPADPEQVDNPPVSHEPGLETPVISVGPLSPLASQEAASPPPYSTPGTEADDSPTREEMQTGTQLPSRVEEESQFDPPLAGAEVNFLTRQIIDGQHRQSESAPDQPTSTTGENAIQPSVESEQQRHALDKWVSAVADAREEQPGSLQPSTYDRQPGLQHAAESPSDLIQPESPEQLMQPPPLPADTRRLRRSDSDLPASGPTLFSEEARVSPLLMRLAEGVVEPQERTSTVEATPQIMSIDQANMSEERYSRQGEQIPHPARPLAEQPEPQAPVSSVTPQHWLDFSGQARLGRIEPATRLREEAAPVIRVTIGRVEVRATTPPMPRIQPYVRPARRKPALSLGDYLRQRSRGR